MKIPDSFDVIFRQAEAKYWFNEEEARGAINSFGESQGVEVDENKLVGMYSGKTGDFFYRWQIQSSDESGRYDLVIKEDILISRKRFYLLFIPPVLISILLADFVLTLSVSTPLLILTALLAFPIYGRSLASLIKIPSLLDETQGYSQKYKMGTSISTFNLLVISVLLVGALGVTTQNIGLAFLAVLATVSLVYIAYTRVEQDGTPLKVRKGVNLRFPPLLTTYLIITGFLSLLPILVLPLYLTLRSPLVLVYGFAGVIFVWYVVRTVLTGTPATESFEKFIEEQPERDQPKVNTVNLVVGILPSVILVYGYIAIVYVSELTIYETNDVVIMTIGFFPGIYLITGVLLQTISFVDKVGSLFRNSKPVETDGILSDYNLRRFESEGYEAYSVSTFSNHYIFVSGALLDDFEDKEVQSIIYHEESHIRNGDSFLSFIIPIICLFTFSPQGVLLESLDFKSREIRSDREAAKRPDNKLEEALNRILRKKRLEPEKASHSTFSPFSGEVNKSRSDEYRLFFGAHAIDEAHPSISERLERL